MHIIHVVRQFYPSVGGIEEVVYQLARSHLNEGGTVEVITLNRLFRKPNMTLPSTGCYKKIQITRLPYWGSSRYPLSPFVIFKLNKADIVHIHGIDFFYDFIALTKIFHRKKIIVSTHGCFFHTQSLFFLKKIWFNTLTRSFSSLYKRVIATSENDFNNFSKIVASNKLKKIENGIDYSKFYDSGCRKPGKTMIYFGRWSFNKGLLQMLDLMKKVVEEDREWLLIISGNEYDYTCDNLMREISKRSLLRNVFLVPSPSNSDIKRLINKSQYFLSLSEFEGFGIAAVESMSAGLIPVLSDIPPYKRLVKISKVGIIVRRNKIYDSIRSILQFSMLNRKNFNDLRQKCMSFSIQYDWNIVCKKYKDQYNCIFTD